MALLRNEGSGEMNVSADFNPYRYLASEGFLPGYSFPRLPIAAYIPGRRGMRGEGDYVQRARFLAIREFGPRALIYHEGARYEVHRVQLPPDAAGEVRTEDAHRCPGCGYHHEVAPGNDRCEMCDAEFTASQYGLLPLHTVFTRQRQRITSDEEERRRAGFRIVTSYRFQDHGDRPGRLDATAKDADGKPVTRLTYGDSALVRRTNLGPTRRPAGRGGRLLARPSHRQLAQRGSGHPQGDGGDGNGGDDRPGRGRRQAGHPVRAGQPEHPRPPARGPGRPRHRPIGHVRPGTRHRGRLPARGRRAGQRAAAAGPRARATASCSPSPPRAARACSAACSPRGRRSGRQPWRHCGSPTSTRRPDEDLGGVTRPLRRAKGCYNCLLSYGNQLVHELIDRHAARSLLLAIGRGETIPAGPGESRTDHSIKLIGQADSTLEAEFIRWLKDNGYRLPDAAQQ